MVSVVGVGLMETSGEVEVYIPPLLDVPVPAPPSMSNALSSPKRDGAGMHIDWRDATTSLPIVGTSMVGTLTP